MLSPYGQIRNRDACRGLVHVTNRNHKRFVEEQRRRAVVSRSDGDVVLTLHFKIQVRARRRVDAVALDNEAPASIVDQNVRVIVRRIRVVGRPTSNNFVV